MDEGRTNKTASTQRHIIERPRLTAMLDAANARIVLLTAPAGYGKTTLARQWVGQSQRRAIWYQATNASADVAALAAGIAGSVEEVVPGSRDVMTTALRSSMTPANSAHALGAVLASHIAAWPKDVWLVVDDYHHLAEAESAEEFMEALALRTTIPILITSRRRPHWVTTRQVLYGELVVVSQDQLAFTESEALELLPSESIDRLSELIHRAQGWPAVVRLAALSGEAQVPTNSAAFSLYHYFAEELYQTIRPELRASLTHLAYLPKLTPDLLSVALGSSYATVCDDAVDAGFLSLTDEGLYDFHPLLREFVQSHSETSPEMELHTELVGMLAQSSRWDEAFELIRQTGAAHLLAPLVENAIDELLGASRISTLETWLTYARSTVGDSPIFALTEAELARRVGDLELGEARALQAARHFEPTDPNCSRAWAVAGECAHLMADREHALAYHACAEEIAPDHAAARRAVWGQLVVAIQYEIGDPRGILSRLQRLDDGTASVAVRIAAGELHLATLEGGIALASRRGEQQLRLLDRVADPLLTTSFLNRLGWVCALCGDYGRGLRHCESAIAEARRSGALFALVHLIPLMISAHIGLRRFQRAEILLDDFRHLLDGVDDAYEELNLRVFRARLSISRGDFERAARQLELSRIEEAPAAALALEATAVRALADAARGSDATQVALSAALETSREAQGQTLGTLAEYVLADTRRQSDADELLVSALAKLRCTENYDSFVATYRAYPRILRAIIQDKLLPPSLLENILSKAKDVKIAREFGLSLEVRSRASSLLSPREREVYSLLCGGMSNREIAQTLYISLATVKVHVRHIFEKLGVHSRAQAIRAAHEDF